MRPLAVVGDALLDRDLAGTASRLAPDAPVPVLDDVVEHARPGGAALAALLAAAAGHPVVLVTALADDEAGRRLRMMLESTVRVVAAPAEGPTAEKIRIRAGDQSVVRLDRGGPTDLIGALPHEAVDAMGDAAAILVSDYGRGVTGHEQVRSAVASAGRPIVWDPHPRGGTPIRGVTLATPNRAEAGHFAGAPLGPSGSPMAAGRVAGLLADEWGASAVAVTLGAVGAVLSYGSRTSPLLVPARAAVGDPCGAGDRFAAAAAVAIADGAVPSEAVAMAVAAASAFVAAGGAAAIAPGRASVGSGRLRFPDGAVRPRAADDPLALVREVRRVGGRVVATGGCFDLLHAGHVQTLKAARSLGDCLVVCLNSDDSIRRSKGVGRPVVSLPDRRRVLEALECVDAVAVFEEDTPERLLDDLRPDVWAKGGDYAGIRLPEEDVLARWGGEVVLLPYLDGHSTTQLVAAAGSTRRGND